MSKTPKRPYINPKELEAIEAHFMKDMPDFTQFETGEKLLEACGDESMKWAAAFSQITKKKLDITIPFMYVQQWVANIIEHSNKLRKQKEETEQKEELKREDITVNDKYWDTSSDFKIQPVEPWPNPPKSLIEPSESWPRK